MYPFLDTTTPTRCSMTSGSNRLVDESLLLLNDFFISASCSGLSNPPPPVRRSPLDLDLSFDNRSRLGDIGNGVLPAGWTRFLEANSTSIPFLAVYPFHTGRATRNTNT